MRVRGQYVVAGDQRRLSSLKCPDVDVFVIFDTGYREQSDSRSIKLLDELQDRSYPYSKPGNASVVVVPYQRADVVVRGRLGPNPEYEPSPPEGALNTDSPVEAIARLQPESAAFAYRFRVERVERVRRISTSTPW